MDEWANPLGVLWDTREPDRSSRLSQAARRVADAMLVESTRPEAEYWPLLLPLPPRNSTKAVAVALTATSLTPLAAAPIAAACGNGPGHSGGPHDRIPSGNGAAQTVSVPPSGGAPAAPAAPAATPAPVAAAPPPASPPPAAPVAPPAAAPVANVAPAPAAPAPVAAAPQPASAPEDVASPRVEPVPLAKTPRLVPSSPSRPARKPRHRPHRGTPQITMQVDPEPVVAPRRHRHRSADPVITMHVTPERPAPALTLRVTLSAKRSHYRVRSGDSLWRIAQSLVGSGAGTGRVVSTVHLLWSLNRGRVASGNENLLATSDVLMIPARREVR